MRNPVLACIENRSSLRTFDSRNIEAEALDAILHAAMRAPSAANLQLYSILVIKEPGTKAILAETCNHQPWIAKAPVLLVFCADYQRLTDFYGYSQVPQACSENGIPFLKPQEQNLLLAECDAMLAAQNAVLAAESLGIGSCYVGHVMDHFERHKELFQLPDYVFPVTLIAMGYPRSERKTGAVSPRFSAQYVVFQEKYHRLTPEELEDCYGRLPVPGAANRYHAQNRGQYHYLKRHMNSDCYQEGIRSVKAALKHWS